MCPRHCAIAFLLTLFSYGHVLGQDSYALDLAQRVVNRAAGVRKGEKVIIFGGAHSLSFAKEISKVCADADAFPVIITTNDSLETLRLADTLGFASNHVTKIMKDMAQARVLIVLCPIINDPSLLNYDLNTSQYERINEYNLRIRLLAEHPGVRAVYVNVATKPIADLLHVKFEDYESMLQKANIVESDLMDANINRLYGLLQNASKVRISSPIGTDISFLIDNRNAIIDDGKITSLEAQVSDGYNRVTTLPAGILKISVIEGSGMGRVVVPDSECNYAPMQQISFKINRGKIEQWNAKTGGACFENLLRINSNNWQFGSIGFSFNWEIKTFNDDGLRLWRDEGGPMIWITLGGNRDLGGKVSNDIRQFSFPIQKPTVEIDDKIAIKTSF